MEEIIQSKEREARRKGDVIHSGHFMISSVADDQEDITETIDHDRDSPVHHEQSIMIKHGYDFSNVAMETKDTYQFGPSQSNHITIDASLSRLFQCMSLAYRGGKVVSPKWKNFKGLKLTVKDKIRLNNAIWRTWHIQYVMMKRKQHSFIQFVTPMEIGGDYETHSKPEAVVMEGKYWKRRIETVVAEYKKWRAFFMERCITSNPDLVTQNSGSLRYGEDQQYTDFTDTLFSSLSQQPFQFPNPREIAQHATNSDMIQPGLLQLQPSVDDFDFDPLQDFFNNTKRPQNSMFGGGHSSHTDFSSVSDPFISSDIASVLEHQIPNTISLTTLSHVPAQQTGGFNIQPQHHVENRSVFETSKLDHNRSTGNHQNINLPQHSPLRSLMQSIEVPQHTSIRPTYLSVEQMKQHMSENNYRVGESHTETNNRTRFVADNNQRQFLYPHSKQGPNKTMDRIIYTNTQMNVGVFQHNPGIQQISQSIAGSTPSQLSHINPEIDQPVVCITKQDEEQKPSDSPSVIILKQLLTNKSTADKSTIKRQGLETQKIQSVECNVAKSNRTLSSSKQIHQNSSSNTSPTKSFVSDPVTFSDVSMDQGEEYSTTFVDDGSAMLQRSGSFSAEQKRRFNIKLGFNRLQQYLPNCNVQSNTKISKASLMNKATQYIKSLQSERQKVSDEIQTLKQELDELKSSISSCQQQLPATGAPVSRPHIEESKTKYKHWVKERTKRDWKFFLFGIIVEPWFESYQCMVSVTSTTDLCRSVFDWVDQKCALPVLRPSVVQSLQVLSTSTSILTQPLQLQKQIEDSVQERNTER